MKRPETYFRVLGGQVRWMIRQSNQEADALVGGEAGTDEEFQGDHSL